MFFAALKTGENDEIINRQSPIANFPCSETIRIQREIDGCDFVRLRDGKVFAPIAFTGSYNPPLIGCIDFSGVADAFIDLHFDRERQALVGFVKVSSVDLQQFGGIGSSVIAGLVQGSNRARKVKSFADSRNEQRNTFVIPIQNTEKASEWRPSTSKTRSATASSMCGSRTNFRKTELN